MFVSLPQLPQQMVPFCVKILVSRQFQWLVKQPELSRKGDAPSLDHLSPRSSSFFSAPTGDALCVTLIVNNLSGRKVRPKFTLYDQQMFTAQHETLTVSNKIMRKRCEVVKPKTLETVTAKFGISKNLPPSALNCSIIKLRYWVEVRKLKNWLG